MRHAASLITSLEGMSRPAFRIGQELALNSRSGLTVRFLAKKIEVPEEEIEYLVDINHQLFFLDLTKVKLVAEGAGAIKRIAEGLENHGDIPSLFRLLKTLNPHEFRRIEEQVGIERPGGKKAAAEELVERYYIHPETVIEYVATRGFSTAAQEVFDVVWQSEDGILPASVLRTEHGGSEYEVEQALAELVQGLALFELFRFDSEERLVRAVALLSEIRQWREAGSAHRKQEKALKPLRGEPSQIDSRGLAFSESVCRLVAAVAAHPARLRSDGDLFREDRRRLEEICPQDEDPPLSTCLWVAQGVDWIARVDNELRAGGIEPLLGMSRIERQRLLFDWLMQRGGEEDSRRALVSFLDELRPGAWYPAVDFIRHVMAANSEHEQPVLRNAGGHWRYINPSVSAHMERSLARSLEETLLWMGVVDRGEWDGESVFRLSPLGHCLLSGGDFSSLADAFPEREAEIVVQPNFDIVVPVQDMDPLLTVPLDQFAIRASSGQVAVYRFNKETFTKAIQEGHDGGAFVAFLLAHNRGGELPANVMATLEGWRGGIKHVRMRTVQLLESDDPLVMADLLHRRKFGKFFERVDPARSVLFTGISKADLERELEKEGFVVQ